MANVTDLYHVTKFSLLFVASTQKFYLLIQYYFNLTFAVNVTLNLWIILTRSIINLLSTENFILPVTFYQQIQNFLKNICIYFFFSLQHLWRNKNASASPKTLGIWNT